MNKTALREWLLFEGRVDRLGFLARAIAIHAVIALPAVLLASQMHPALTQLFFLGALAPPYLWIFFGLQMRRLHDMSRSGLWVAIPWMTVILASWFEYSRGIPAGETSKSRLLLVPWWLFLILAPGKPGPNSYGSPSA